MVTYSELLLFCDLIIRIISLFILNNEKEVIARPFYKLAITSFNS